MTTWTNNPAAPAPLPTAPQFSDLELEAFIVNCETAQSGKVLEPMRKKLDSFAERFGLPPELVLNKFLTDDIFRYTFGMAPGRQTFHERLALDYLASLPLFVDFIKPPAVGGQSLLITPMGTITEKHRIGSAARSSRSIDFQWTLGVRTLPDRHGELRTLTAYASHKYTKGQGGSQDKQRQELMDFLDNASQQTTPGDTVFFAIADGDHYPPHTADLRAHCKGPQAVLATTAGTPKLWAKHARDWLARNGLPTSAALEAQLALLESGPESFARGR